MRGRNRQWRGVALTALSALSMASCNRGLDVTVVPQISPGVAAFSSKKYDLPECPVSWTVPWGKDSYAPAPSGEFGLIKQITNIPEFHDCQKLLTRQGQEYGPLVAIFAAYDLETLETRLDSLESVDSIAQPTVYGRTSLAAALILNLGERYPSLGILPGFSCVYLWRKPVDKDWKAQIVWVNNDERRCLDTIAPPSGNGNLTLYRDQAKGFRLNKQYPAVARWDWDQSTNQQYIGIKCGQAWCEIGNSVFVRQPAYLPAPTVYTSTEQVLRIKGWYDDQRLAEPDKVGTLRPGKARGIVIPDPSLGTRTMAEYSSTPRTFLPVAYIALSRKSEYYKRKLNLDMTPAGAPLGSLNRLSFCRGTRADCLPVDVAKPPPPVCDLKNANGTLADSAWWGRIDPANGGASRYTCAYRMDHTAQVGIGKLPATARWRWLLNDETIWKECVTGCCQVRPLQ